MRRPALVLALLLGALAAAPALGAERAAPPNRLPGATAYRVCGGAGPYWPTMTLALNGPTAWIACKEEARVIRFDTTRGKVVGSLRLGVPVIAVATGFRSVWALDSAGTLYRIGASPLRVVKRIALGVGAPYNIWLGAGAVWVVDDRSGELIRVAPETNRVTARIAVGDGPADMVFAGTTAWVVNHRDRGLIRLDTRTNKAERLTTLPGDAPERMTLLGGRLWITGRGTDLLEVDPDGGSVKATIEIGGSGIDVIAAGGSLWVPARSVAVDPTGFPTMEALRRVSPSGAVTEVSQARGRLDVHGLAAGRGAVWLADNTAGVLYRVRL